MSNLLHHSIRSALKRITSLLLIASSLPDAHMWSQSDSLAIFSNILTNQIEPFVDNLGVEGSFDFNTLAEDLEQYFYRPLDINTATRTDLENLGLLSDIQIVDLLQHRDVLSDFISIYELQSLASFDLSTLQVIRHFVRVGGSIRDIQLSPLQMVTQGKNELYLRWDRFLQSKRGFKIDEGKSQPAYQGDPNHLYLRFRHNYEYKLSYGFTLEKDAGEELWSTQNGAGPDFFSAHLFMRDYNKRLKYLALGDYSVSLGQGLIMHSGFGRGKSSFVTSIKRGGQVIRPYTSVNEFAFMRGAALGLEFGPLNTTIFASHKREDANLILDSLDNEESFLRFTSLQSSGLHRTPSEIEDRNAIRRTMIGARIGMDKSRFSLHANVLHAAVQGDFTPTALPYNQFFLPGNALLNLSIDYTYIYRNFHFFGETAASDNGGLATTNGLLIGLNRYADLAILYRSIDRSYQGIQPNAFLESSRAVNERGVYLGAKIAFGPRLWINAYADFWQHPWLSFAIDAPSTGREYFGRLTYYLKRKLEAYIQFRNEIKARNFRQFSDPLNRIHYGYRRQVRFHVGHQITPHLELRNRIEFSATESAPSKTSTGFMLYQDLIYKPVESALSFTARIAYFDTDDFSSRIYAYENDILYSFSVPPYYNEGIRYYLNLRIKKRAMTFELRWAETRFRHLDFISTGNEEIQGNVRTRIKAQIRYDF